jgi:hypothetical protein
MLFTSSAKVGGHVEKSIKTVVSRIQELGIEVVPIPGGCTCVVQPVDVGFNTPFKSAYRAYFRSWLVQKAMLYGTIQCPERQQWRCGLLMPLVLFLGNQ